jgi:hypothetical protein
MFIFVGLLSTGLFAENCDSAKWQEPEQSSFRGYFKYKVCVTENKQASSGFTSKISVKNISTRNMKSYITIRYKETDSTSSESTWVINVFGGKVKTFAVNAIAITYVAFTECEDETGDCR